MSVPWTMRRVCPGPWTSTLGVSFRRGLFVKKVSGVVRREVQPHPWGMDSRDGPGHLLDDVIRARGRALQGAAGGTAAWARAGAESERGDHAGAAGPVGPVRERARLLSVRGSAAAAPHAAEPADPPGAGRDRGGR